MTTGQTPIDAWQDIPWKRYERNVFRLQKRIYQASQRGNVKAVHRLQRLLMKSWSARCLAVRRVTQDNQGKKTAGVDGVKALTQPQRLTLSRKLSLAGEVKPLRRVWIPKPGSTEKRGLGIPTLENRATQALAKLALEPEWEAHFEPNSYGFRPGRSAHDAIEAIHSSIQKQPKYVLDADIAKCFDRINHQALLNKLGTYPTLRRVIKAWLQAGVLDGDKFCLTSEGTPQGGVISPLLANIALHGLEAVVAQGYPQRKQPRLVRYADDLVVLHEDLAAIEQAQERIKTWLTELGLELKSSKTRITHTLHEHDGAVGFDFLGFNVRQYPVGQTHSGKKGRKGRPSLLLGFKTIIRPSQEAQRRHLASIREIIHSHRTAPQAALIEHLNPIIRGWTAYFSTKVAKKVFRKLEHQTFLKLRRWAFRRHPHKPRRWIVKKYWRLEYRGWTFGVKDGARLYHHSDRPVRRHVKVQGNRSPYDGDWAYWGARLGAHPELPIRVAILLKRQKGRCPRCGLHFTAEDLLEIDHIVPTACGGKDEYANWQLLHRHCHDWKTAKEALTA